MSLDQSAQPRLNVYACGIPIEGGRILLGLRAPHRRIYANCWDVLGGRVERGESVKDALIRELGEEIGIRPTAFEYLRSVSDHVPTAGGILRYEMFLVRGWEGHLTMRGDEHTRLGWFTIEEAVGLARLAVEDYRDLFRMIGSRRAQANL